MTNEESEEDLKTGVTYEKLQRAIAKVGRFESLIQLPTKRDPDWPKWGASGLKNEVQRFNVNGETDLEALQKLLEALAGA